MTTSHRQLDETYLNGSGDPHTPHMEYNLELMPTCLL